MKKIVVTGGTGRFGSVLRSFNTKYKILFPAKKELNILNLESIRLCLKKDIMVIYYLSSLYKHLM